jgi:hypothetical protein
MGLVFQFSFLTPSFPSSLPAAAAAATCSLLLLFRHHPLYRFLAAATSWLEPKSRFALLRLAPLRESMEELARSLNGRLLQLLL